MSSKNVVALVALCVSAFTSVAKTEAEGSNAPDDEYATYGVHNDSHSDLCSRANCIYLRSKGEPTDPIYPRYWTSHWAMYRVFNRYQDNPPPYDGKPPDSLQEGKDYETTWGVSYYDSTWVGPTGTGAMEEDYDKSCLPIFPIPNNYSCSFISLGSAAFFVTYDDRPSWMPRVCLFSPHNPPPEQDFIKHLPYSKQDSVRLNNRVQAYAFWIGEDGKPMQTGVTPDQTVNRGIMFGYAFDTQPTADRLDKTVAPYRHPQSFYFSGMPYMPQVPLPNAPIISQNYTDFAMIKPERAATWAKVEGLNPKSLPKCQLYNPPSSARVGAKPAEPGISAPRSAERN